jgi:hypothetical protein
LWRYKPHPADHRPGNAQDANMTIFFASGYPFLNIFWTILIFFALVIWMVIMVLIDVFRAVTTTSQAGPGPPG